MKKFQLIPKISFDGDTHFVFSKTKKFFYIFVCLPAGESLTVEGVCGSKQNLIGVFGV